MTASVQPSARLRRLATTLRDLRTGQGLSRKQVFERTGINTATLYRAEAARVRPQTRTLNTLLTLYQVTEAQRRTLTELMSESEHIAWLNTYADLLSATSRTALELEHETHTLHTYNALHIPDLLQTPAYTRAVIHGGHPTADHHTTERHIELRTRRRTALTRPHQPPRLHAVCDEAVLHRLVGGPDVMHEQLHYLTEIAELPNLTLQLIPFTTGAYPATPASFTVIHLTGGTSAIHIQDVAAGDRVLTTTQDIRHHTDLHTHLHHAALPPAESLELITTHARQMNTPD